MMVVLGVGNTLRSDDGVGCYIACTLMAIDQQSERASSEPKGSGSLCRISAINGGTAPENWTAPIRRLRPDLLIIVDAAAMDLPPGSIRIIPEDLIDDTSIGTHMLPLSHLIRYLSPDIPEIIFIGIQPETVEMGEGLSPPVQRAAEILIQMMLGGELMTLEEIGSKGQL